MVNDKVESLKDSLEGRLEEFFVSVDQVKISVTGSGELQSESIPVWQRVVAAGGGLLLSGYAGAALGATSGLNADFAKGIALQVGAYLLLGFLGILNPVTIIAVIVASAVGGGVRAAEKATIKAKAQIADSYCTEISNNSMQLVDKTIDGAVENFDKIKDIISNSMDVEIEEMQKQLEGIIRDMEQGKEVIEQKSAQLSEYEKGLKKTAENLDTFIFELLK